MLFQTFTDDGLSQYSYLVGCPEAGTAAVVDPRRDIEVYTRAAEEAGLAIDHVFETHIHADFASGARELARTTGAVLHLSVYDEGEDYDVAFAHREMRDGDAIELGSVRLEARHTPGHTPEHLAFLVFDTSRSADVPQIMLSGDFLFVGSLGRPDLLGEEGARDLAERLYESVQRLDELPDGLEIRPGHGSGSMCGAGMSGRPLSTLGYERAANPYFASDLSKEDFIERILGTVPPFPDYYRKMKALNSAGPPLLGGGPDVEWLTAADVADLAPRRYTILDLRDKLSFNASHIPGSLGIGEGVNLAEWAAWVVPYDRPIILIPPRDGRIDQAVKALTRVGLDDIIGALEGGIDAWIEAGHRTERIDTVSPAELRDRMQQATNGGGPTILDVRSDAEWSDGHLRGAVHITAGELEDRLDELPGTDERLAVYCGSGYRSTVAASILERAGYHDVLNVMGGMTGWKAADHPVVG